MDQTRMLLQSIVENARMGADACGQLLEKCRNADLREELLREREQYENAARSAEGQLQARGIQPHPKGAMACMGMWMGMQFNTMTDTSASHIAEITIQGANMGVVEITKMRNSCPDAGAEAQGVASNLIAQQQDAIDRLKAFLQEKVVVE